jgi:alanine racemase
MAQALQVWPVHLEIETGMNRLGISVNDVPALAEHLAATSLLKIESVFTHLAASEDPAQDAFTQQQKQLLQQAITILEATLPYSFLKHISNSAAITRHPDLQLDMVRLGIGLYGVGEKSLELQPAATLRSTIAQIKQLKKGETVSYNRRGVLQRDSVIATVRIGYADGYSRKFSNGIGNMWVGGALAPVIGVVCMDMTMVDITGIEGVKEGDEVLVFGAPLPVQQLAQWIDTIPYELMTSISQRVKRVYFQE